MKRPTKVDAEVLQQLGTGTGRTTYREEVEAYVLEDAPGLMIHRPVGSTATRGDWRISHRPSGQALSLDTFPSFGLALDIVQQLAALGDWTRSAGEILLDREFSANAHALIREALVVVREREFFRVSRRGA